MWWVRESRVWTDVSQPKQDRRYIILLLSGKQNPYRNVADSGCDWNMPLAVPRRNILPNRKSVNLLKRIFSHMYQGRVETEFRRKRIRPHLRDATGRLRHSSDHEIF